MTLSSDMRFHAAANQWLQVRAVEVSQKAAREYLYIIGTLASHFGDVPLSSINLDRITSFQQEWSAKLGRAALNHHIRCLAHILNDAELWEDIKWSFRPIGQSQPTIDPTTKEQQVALFRIASSRPRWRVAYLCSMLLTATGVRPGQICQLTIGSVDLENARIRVFDQDWANIKRLPEERRPLSGTWVILNVAGHWAARELLDRARKIGATYSSHHLLPASNRDGSSGFDFSRHKTDWRTEWKQIRAAAGMPTLEMEDLRFSCISEFLPNRDNMEPSHQQTASEAEAILGDSPVAPSDVDGVAAVEPSVVNRSETALIPSEVRSSEIPPLPRVNRACPHCQYVADEDDRFCARCGTCLQPTRVCVACGSPRQLTDAFCRKCGHEQH